MKKDLLAASFLILMLTVIGCNSNPQKTVGMAPKTLTAAANALTVEHIKYLSYGGVSLIVVGILVLAFTKKAAGAILVFGGAGMSFLYASIAEFPLWGTVAVMVMFLVGCVIAILWMITQKRLSEDQIALTEAVAVIQPHNDLKREMCDGDTEKQDKIRPAIDRVKRKLREEGKI